MLADLYFMKATILSMIIVLCVLATIPALLIGDRSILARFGLDKFAETEQAPTPPKNLTTVTTDKQVQVYKWRDENGVMQFTSAPPLESEQVEVVELRPDTNIIQAIKVPEEEPETRRSGPKVMTVGNPYTPGGMKDLLESTTSIAEDMNQKQMEHQELLNQIMGIQNKK